ncbi:MAG: MIP family channel protein [Deltaproteobacteria bacterium]|nr:MIP family channel protein [Deltaproteobacteria bacterium]
MKRYISEFIGTYFLVFIGTGSIVVNQIYTGAVTHTGISLAFGLSVFLMVYIFGNISGGHINPAVTIGLAACKRFPSNQVLPYITAQLSGAVAASFSLYLLFGNSTTLGITLPIGSSSQSFTLEFIMTFLLMFVIMCVAAGKKINWFGSGLAIGAAVGIDAFLGGRISGASMNPARSFGPAIVAMNFESHWIYWLAPVSGSVFGALLHRCMFLNHRFS